jgi:transposase
VIAVAPKPVGRPTKLTPKLQAEICTSLGTGAYVETAAALHGVSKVTLYEWFKRGNSGEEPYVGFLNAVKRAEAASEQAALMKIVEAGEDPKNWTAHAWRLERKHPDRWGRREKVDLTIDGEVEHVHRFEPDATFLTKVAANLRDLRLPAPEEVIVVDVAAVEVPIENVSPQTKPESNGHTRQVGDDLEEFVP